MAGTIERLNGKTSAVIRSERTDKLITRHVSDVIKVYNPKVGPELNFHENLERLVSEQQGEQMDIEEADKEVSARAAMMDASLKQPYRQSVDIDDVIDKADKVEQTVKGKTNGTRRSRRLQGLDPIPEDQ